MTDRDGGAPRDRPGTVVGMLVNRFEEAIYGIAFLLLAESPALAQTVRYELFPEPDVRQTATNRTASAYVVDKKVNQFWICTARYDFSRPDG